jgi:queuine tRNA-ribosyltransferase
MLSPEVSIETQKAIGSDIMMALDHCVASTADEATARAAMEITARWAARSLAARGDSLQSMFAIVQGALVPELRRASVDSLGALAFDGYAIGGLAVGESKEEREEVTEFTAELLPADKPRYLMGVGTPLDILEAVHRGVDMFDCIMPTQLAQRGRRVYLARIPADAARRLQILRGAARSGVRVPDVRSLQPRLSASPDKGFRDARLDAAREAQHPTSTTSSCAISARAFSRTASSSSYREKRSFLAESDLRESDRADEAQKHGAMRLGDYEIHIAREGFASIRQAPPARSCTCARRRWRKRGCFTLSRLSLRRAYVNRASRS